MSTVCDKHNALEDKVDAIQDDIKILIASNSQMELLLKYVVVPLVTLIGVIFGVKELVP